MINNFIYIISYIFNDNEVKFLLALTSFSLFYFFYLMLNNKYNLYKKQNTETIFYTFFLFVILTFIITFFIVVFIYKKENTDLNILIFNILESSYLKYISLGIILYLIFFIFSFFTFKRKKAFQTKNFDFEIKDKKLKIIKKMDNIQPFYKYNKNNNKVYIKNIKVYKLTKLKKDNLTEFQILLLTYLRKITKQKTVKEKYFEFEILRLTQLTKDLKLDLKLGQFRSIATEAKDNEILGAIYNLRENSITTEGYNYFIQYIKTVKARKGE